LFKIPNLNIGSHIPPERCAALTMTARDLGSPGRDGLFGAGEADAFAAVQAADQTPATSAVVGCAQGGQRTRRRRAKMLRKRRNCRPFRRSIPPVAAMASEKSDFCDSAAGQAIRIWLPEFVP
jgi:hypothetical protein